MNSKVPNAARKNAHLLLSFSIKSENEFSKVCQEDSYRAADTKRFIAMFEKLVFSQKNL